MPGQLPPSPPTNEFASLLTCNLYVWYVVAPLFIGWRMKRIGYSGVGWWLLALFSAPDAALLLASSLPNRSVEMLRSDEEELLEQQLLQAGLPIKAGEQPSDRETITDHTTQGLPP